MMPFLMQNGNNNSCGLSELTIILYLLVKNESFYKSYISFYAIPTKLTTSNVYSFNISSIL